MSSDRLITEPSVILVSQPQLVAEGIHRFAERAGLLDYPKLYADTPIGRLLEHVDADPEDRTVSDGEMLIEFAGRQCYRAWRKGRENEAYIKNILEVKHGSVLAHAHFSFHLADISRALSLELNRHAAGNDISQESQRFVDASDANFVVPPALLDLWAGDLECESAQRWAAARHAEVEDYIIVQKELTSRIEAEPSLKKRTMLQKRANEAARASLPAAVETQGVWTFNFRSLRHIINLRGDQSADLEIRRFAAVLAGECKTMAPNVFYDVEIGQGDYGVPVTTCIHEKP
jgi:thymidylate synthase (FAD)